MTGYQPEEIIGQTPSCLRGPDSNGAEVAKIRRAFSRREPLRLELINYCKDGSTYWVELNSVPVADEFGNLTHWVSVQRDISDRKRMEQAFFEEKELAQVTLQSIGDAVIATDANGCVSTLNPVAEKLTGWSTSEAQGLPLARVLRIVDETTRMPIENIAQIALCEGRIVDQGQQLADCPQQSGICDRPLRRPHPRQQREDRWGRRCVPRCHSSANSSAAINLASNSRRPDAISQPPRI